MEFNLDEFEGPRRMRPEEARSGGELFKICFGGDINTEIAAARPHQRGGWYVILHRGKVVSQISLSHSQVELYGGHLRIGSVGGVSTHPDYRGQGLAGRLLNYCAHRLAQEGARLMLISGERGLYQRTGNVPAMCFTAFTLRACTEGGRPISANSRLKVRSIEASDLSACARLYQAEPVRFLRLLEEYRDALRHLQGWLFEQDGIPRAYLLMRTPWEYRDSPEQGVREVEEYAGSRLILAEGLRRALAGDFPLQPAVRELRMAIPWQEVDFLQLLEGFARPQGRTALPGHTMRLLNFPALRRDLAVYIAARLPRELRRGLRFEQCGPLLANPVQAEDCGRMALVFHGRRTVERLELSSAEMTTLVIGGSERSGGGTPPAVKGALGEIVPVLFPLPSFLVGINYR